MRVVLGGPFCGGAEGGGAHREHLLDREGTFSTGTIFSTEGHIVSRHLSPHISDQSRQLLWVGRGVALKPAPFPSYRQAGLWAMMRVMSRRRRRTDLHTHDCGCANHGSADEEKLPPRGRGRVLSGSRDHHRAGFGRRGRPDEFAMGAALTEYTLFSLFAGAFSVYYYF